MADLPIVPDQSLPLVPSPALSSTNDRPSVETTPDSQAKPEAAQPEDATPATGAEELPGEVQEQDLPPPIKREITMERNRRRAAEERAERAEFERSQLATALQRAQPQQQPAEEAKPPKAEDFEDPDAFIDAKIQYGIKQGLQQALTERERRDAAERQQRELAQTRERYNASVEKARSKHPDFAEVAEARTLPVTEPMALAIFDSPIGGEIQYWLGKHRDEAARIAGLAPLTQAREIGRIEAQISAPPEKKAAVTQAPAPVTPVGAQNKVEVDLQSLPTSEYIRRTREMRKAGISY